MILSRIKPIKKTNLFAEQKKEREGFEPSIVLCFELYRFSRPELSTTRPPLRKVKTIYILFFILANRIWSYELIPLLPIERYLVGVNLWVYLFICIYLSVYIDT